MSVQLKRFGMYSYGWRQWTQRSVDTDPLLRSAKYDEGRQGHRVTGTRMDLATATLPFDLSQELYVRPDQCEARRSSQPWQGHFRLTYGKFNKMLKRVLLGVGLGPDLRSTHSCYTRCA